MEPSPWDGATPFLRGTFCPRDLPQPWSSRRLFRRTTAAWVTNAGCPFPRRGDEATTSAAIEAAKYVADHLDRLSNSKPGDTNRSAKVEEFCLKFVAAGFHRPLDQEEKRRTKLRNPTSKPPWKTQYSKPQNPGVRNARRSRARAWRRASRGLRMQ